MNSTTVFVHIVAFNSESTIVPCVQSVLNQEGFELGKNLQILVSDNASTDKSVEKLQSITREGIKLKTNNQNLGFCAAHNRGLYFFLAGECNYYLCLNPDLFLRRDALLNLSNSIRRFDNVGAVCPKLLRASAELNPIEPNIIDATGMYITPSLRHFDRGSGEIDKLSYENPSFVFGASGACVLFKREFIKSMEIHAGKREADIDVIYPQLATDRNERVLLFDEAFFAYREDADLAWRAQLFGWRTFYEPKAVGYHVRHVTSENRSEVSKNLNYLGVRNRFLLQINQYSFAYGIGVLINGILIRNLVVVFAVFLKERSSFKAFFDILKLLRRGLSRRNIIRKRSKLSAQEVGKWFRYKPHIEEISE